MRSTGWKGFFVRANGATKIAKKPMVGLVAVFFTCLALGMPLARADEFSATAGVDLPCEFGQAGTSAGGEGFTSVTAGPNSCSYVQPATSEEYPAVPIAGSGYASGSWITGVVEAQADASIGDTGGMGEEDVRANVVLKDIGVLTLPRGTPLGQIQLGVTDVSDAASGSGESLSYAEFFLGILPTGIPSQGYSGPVSCVFTESMDGYPGTGGAPCPVSAGLPSVTATVFNGEEIELLVAAHTVASVDANFGSSAAASVTVDPLFLTLPPGATFDSSIPGFLTGTTTVPSPEPSTFLLLGAGLLALFAQIGNRPRVDRVAGSNVAN